jgi:amino acid adenylation domain-containing protein
MTKKVLNFPQRIHQHAIQQPKKLAIHSANKKLNYTEFSNLITAIHQKIKSITEQTSRIGVLVNDLVWAYPSIMAILQSNSVYVPLNHEFPNHRLKDIVEDADIDIILCQTSSMQRAHELLDGHPSPFAIDIQNIQEIGTKFPPTLSINQTSNIQDKQLAYMMYTSGTTGKPKGVPIHYAALSSFISWAINKFELNSEDRFTQHSRLSFDLSIFDIFATFAVGGTLYPIENKIDLAFPGAFLKKHQISICLCVPGVIRTMDKAQQLKNKFSSHLRHLLVCGEALPPSSAKLWIQKQPDTPLHNLYGPTEATIACSHQKVDRHHIESSSESIPIGTPTQGTQLYILDQELTKELPIGEVGKLMIGGIQLSQGYWKKHQLNLQVFKQHPTSGCRIYDSGDLAKVSPQGHLLWMGRADQQVNINGYRIELMEIEGHVNSMNLFQECVVIAHGEPLELKLVVSGVTHASKSKLLKDVRDHLSKHLPEYMIPEQIECLEKLPRNSNGKIDRKKIISTLNSNP